MVNVANTPLTITANELIDDDNPGGVDHVVSAYYIHHALGKDKFKKGQPLN